MAVLATPTPSLGDFKDLGLASSALQADISDLVETSMDTSRFNEESSSEMDQPKPKKPRMAVMERAGGVYIPPFKAAMMVKPVNEEYSEEWQRERWQALKKSINGLVNKVNTTNIEHIVLELFNENIIRGRGLLVRSLINAQLASVAFTNVYAALIAIVNTKLPEVGELLCKRVILRFKKAFRRNDKLTCMGCTSFIAHLVNQQVAHEIVALEMVYLLLDKPTEDSVELSASFVKECGAVLTELIPKGVHAIFERFRGILHDGSIDIRIQYIIESLFSVRKDKFKNFPAIVDALDLVEEDDQIPHELGLNVDYDGEAELDVFKFDECYAENEAKYSLLKEDILGSDSESESAAEEVEVEDEAVARAEDKLNIDDQRGGQDVEMRKKIYLTIMSSANFEEAAHKLLKMVTPTNVKAIGEMMLECCAQERTYQKFYGLIGERFCRLTHKWQDAFDNIFADKYQTIHRLETNQIRNTAKFYAHLLYTDAIDWGLLEYIVLTEEETTSSSRIFIKILFQELAECMTIKHLNIKLAEPELAEPLQGIFPTTSPHAIRFSINFFTSIGLGAITEASREVLQALSEKAAAEAALRSDSDDDSSGYTSSDDDSREPE